MAAFLGPGQRSEGVSFLSRNRMNFATKQLLQQYYNLDSKNLPQQMAKADWKPENNFGFLLGLLDFGINTHITQLHSLLHNNQFKDQEHAFINSMFDCYIRPFHKSYNTDSECCHTPSTVSSRTPSKSNSTEDLDYVLPEEKELVHKDLKKAVAGRDLVCLFCWDKLECEGAHIIAQKNIPMASDESSLLQRAGLTQKHQVQNGLLLCKICHSQFDKLKRYVDFIDDKLVVKVVNESNETNSDKHREWKEILEDLEVIRKTREKRWIDLDNRKAVETNEEMALYFVQNNPTKLPNRHALEFHKAACLIWRMAGGAEPDEEYCSDDDEVAPVDTAALKRRFNIPAQDSSSTLHPDNDSETQCCLKMR